MSKKQKDESKKESAENEAPAADQSVHNASPGDDATPAKEPAKDEPNSKPTGNVQPSKKDELAGLGLGRAVIFYKEIEDTQGRVMTEKLAHVCGFPKKGTQTSPGTVDLVVYDVDGVPITIKRNVQFNGDGDKKPGRWAWPVRS